MAVILEVKAGPMSGEKIVVRTGETVTFGRAAGRANFALPHDTFMSGIHFAVECGPQGPELKDRGSSNGTFVNGARVKESPLTNGDEVRSGQTSFSIRLIADEKLPQPVATSRPSAAPPPPPVPAAPARPPAPPPLPAILPGSIDDAFSASVVHPPPRPQQNIPPTAPPAIPAQNPPVLHPVVQPVVPSNAPPIERPASPISVSPAPGYEAPVRPAQPAPGKPAAAGKPTGKPPVFTVGSWAFSVVPQGWAMKSEFGMERAEEEGFPSSVTATEEMIGGNPVLGPFVESQLSMLREYLREPKIEAVVPPAIPGAEEKASVDVRYSTKDGQIIFYRRLYARSGNTVGTITLMTLEKEFASIAPAFDAIVAGTSFQVKTPA